jgi:5-methylcytosine-specific restriction endonuclease McrA
MKTKVAKYNKWKKANRPNVNIPSWPKIRKKILDRDDYICRICGDDGNDEALNVHHIDYTRSNNSPKNLVTLCAPCHRAVHDENYRPYEHDDYPAPWGLVE